MNHVIRGPEVTIDLRRLAAVVGQIADPLPDDPGGEGVLAECVDYLQEVGLTAWGAIRFQENLGLPTRVILRLAGLSDHGIGRLQAIWDDNREAIERSGIETTRDEFLLSFIREGPEQVARTIRQFDSIGLAEDHVRVREMQKRIKEAATA